MNEFQFNEVLNNAMDVCGYLDEKFHNEYLHKSLKGSFKYELLKFAIYLSSSDNLIETKEVILIRRLLDVSAIVSDMNVLKNREHIPYGFRMEIPMSIAQAVKCDAEMGTEGPYKRQCAQILIDTYKMFGQFFLALHDNEPSNEIGLAYTVYISNLEEYLKEYGVFYTSKQKRFPILELERIENGMNNIPVNAKNKDINEDSNLGNHEQSKEEDYSDESGDYIEASSKKEDKKEAQDKEQDETTLEEKLEEFHAMIGLDSVKKEVDALVNLIRIQNLRKEMGIKVSDISKHMVFSGNPGTGKTTVARILAGIYKDLGVLREGKLVEVDRSGLVKGYVGQTAVNVKKVIDSAKGGILFIDEAYTLTVGKGDSDYGQEAVDTILKAMEDMRDDLVVIVAGYPDLMIEFLESNPGLKSRFNKFIYFEDYTAEQQVQILESMCEKQQYVLSDFAEQHIYDYLRNKMKNPPKDFANARDIRNMFERAILKQASRVILLDKPTREQLLTLEKEDFDLENENNA